MRPLALAALRRDFALARSYRVPFVLDLSSAVFSLALIFGIGRVVTQANGHASPVLGGYFAFAVLGLILLRLVQTALVAQANRVRLEAATGTLEVLLSGPVSAWRVLAACSAYDVVFAVVTSVATFVLAVAVFGLRLHVEPLTALVALTAFLASLVFAVGLGLAFTACTLLVKQTSALLGFAAAGLTLFSGVYFPLHVLPVPLRAIGSALPLTWGLEVLRGALLEHQTRAGLLAALAGADVVVLAGGLWLVEFAVRRARRVGSLGQY